jgi:hypothetical protein
VSAASGRVYGVRGSHAVKPTVMTLTGPSGRQWASQKRTSSRTNAHDPYRPSVQTEDQDCYSYWGVAGRSSDRYLLVPPSLRIRDKVLIQLVRTGSVSFGHNQMANCTGLLITEGR